MPQKNKVWGDPLLTIYHYLKINLNGLIVYFQTLIKRLFMNTTNSTPLSLQCDFSDELIFPDRFVREEECKLISGLSRTRRWELEQEGKFPLRIKISERSITWKLSSLLNWMEERANA